MNFKHFLKEETQEEKLKHLAHPGDHVIDAGKAGVAHSIKTLREVHKAVQGKPSSAKITTKYDGSPSIVFGRHPQTGRFFVASKSAFNKTPKINYTEEDIDANHGQAPGLAEKLKQALKHLPKVTPEHGVYQGDIMHTKDDVHEMEGRLHFSPNVISYSTEKDSEEGKKIKRSKIGVAVHTAYHGDSFDTLKAEHGFKPSNFTSHPDVHVIDTSSEPEPVKKSEEVEKHLNKAEELAKSHDFSHHEGHEETMRQYVNDTVRSSSTPTAAGYKAFLMKKGEKKTGSLKSEKGQAKARESQKKLMDHVDANKEKFDTSFRIHQHIEKAKDALTHSLANSKQKFEHTINGKPSKPEGFVATINNRPTKLVDRAEFSKANFEKVREEVIAKAQALSENFDYKLSPTVYDLGMKIRGGFAYHPSVYQYLTDEQIDELDEHDKVLFARTIKQRNVIDE